MGASLETDDDLADLLAQEISAMDAAIEEVSMNIDDDKH